MNRCSEYLDMIQREVDGELNELEKKKLEKHVQQCPSCAEEYNVFLKLDNLFDNFEMEEPPMMLKEMVMSEILAEETVAEKTKKEFNQIQLSIGIGLLIVIAGLNAIFFLTKLIPFVKVETISYRNIVFYQVIFQIGGRFAAVGTYLFYILKLTSKTIIQIVPWNLIGFIMALMMLLLLCLWSLISWNKKRGDLV
ncbi:MAG: zf-HC2 domain-containing protein [Halanaerobiales bacterium]|nr:zf-HC2 domain-containing protein [Halanaerobiales bacterium]